MRTGKIFRGILLFLGVSLAVWIGMTVYFQSRFCPGTWINGVYCTGMTTMQASEELSGNQKAPLVVLFLEADREERIDLADCGYRLSIAPLEAYRKEQSAWLWPLSFFKKQEYTVPVNAVIDEDLLEKKWEVLSFVQEQNQPGEVFMTREEDGYHLTDTMTNRLDTDKVFLLLAEKVRSVLASGQAGEEIPIFLNEIDLNGQNNNWKDNRENNEENSAENNRESNQESNQENNREWNQKLSREQYPELYYQLPYTAEQQQILNLWEQTDRFQRHCLIYDMGDEQITITGGRLTDFLQKTPDGLPATDAGGALLPDHEKIEAFITGLCEEYNTYGKERRFYATRGEEVTVPAGSYGTQLNSQAELTWLKNTISRFLSEKEDPADSELCRIPEYTRQGFCRGKDDIGDTYIEIDLTQQKMYFYQGGSCLVSTDIVTGNTGKKWGTPAGAYYVYAKQCNRYLRGPGYRSFVKYWMPVNKNIGIHDASWRKEFGGEIYKKGGSHGCINTPTDAVTLIYENAVVGTPVIIFY